jgi:peptidoglycan L-alanyl-D-glutamate endopeptidase CwlK
MLIKLAFLMGALLSALAWVGWRFFFAPMRLATERLQIGEESCHGFEQARSSNGVARIKSRRRDLFRFLHWTALVPVIVVALVVVGVLSLSGWISLDPLQVPQFQRGEHIQFALNPEKLVVPQALPPSMFINTERPDLVTADRNWGRLNPAFTQTVLLVLARMEARGYPMALLEGYRSPERQDMLAASGAHVTNARAYQSKHQYGLAADLAPVKDGRLRISEQDSWAMQAYQALGDEVERAGLVWGGRWSLKDYGHIEVAGPVGTGAKK